MLAPLGIDIIIIILTTLVIKHTLFIKCMLSSSYKLLLIKCMHLIGVAFYEPNLDRLESMWSPDIFGEMIATNNEEDRVSDKLPALVILSGSYKR